LMIIVPTSRSSMWFTPAAITRHRRVGFGLRDLP
jgi:hypothetical protein